MIATNKTILAIESSCDETSAAVVSGDGNLLVKIHSNIIASQVKVHAEFGGIFPDLAAREHLKKIIPTIALALHQANLLDDLQGKGMQVQRAIKKLDAIAVTQGPGLIGSLLIGNNVAATLAYLTKTPILPINHWEGHLYSIFTENSKQVTGNKAQGIGLPKFPILYLTVSGGHTSLILMRGHFQYEVLGRTVDDAAGEAFDKVARMLGLGFPGGPAISQAAQAARSADHKSSIQLPRPKLNDPDFNFSFSGLKTAVLYAIQKGEISLPQDVSTAAREAEEAIVEVLVAKLVRATEKYQPASVSIVGGVAANHWLRSQVQAKIHLPIYLPTFKLATDNAAMIGAAAIFRYVKKQGIKNWRDIAANANLRLE